MTAECPYCEDGLVPVWSVTPIGEPEHAECGFCGGTGKMPSYDEIKELRDTSYRHKRLCRR